MLRLIRIIENSKLQKLLTQGPNYREPRSNNFNKALVEITTSSDNCIENLASKNKYNVNKWKTMIFEKINLKIKQLKTKAKPHFIKPILSDPDALAYLATLHRKYVIFPINKANNILCVHLQKVLYF